MSPHCTEPRCLVSLDVCKVLNCAHVEVNCTLFPPGSGSFLFSWLAAKHSVLRHCFSYCSTVKYFWGFSWLLQYLYYNPSLQQVTLVQFKGEAETFWLPHICHLSTLSSLNFIWNGWFIAKKSSLPRHCRTAVHILALFMTCTSVRTSI